MGTVNKANKNTQRTKQQQVLKQYERKVMKAANLRNLVKRHGLKAFSEDNENDSCQSQQMNNLGGAIDGV